MCTNLRGYELASYSLLGRITLVRYFTAIKAGRD